MPRLESPPLMSSAARLVLLVGLPWACGPLAGVAEKPCRPGCVDGATRLVCDDGLPRAEACPTSDEPCAAALCEAGTCTFRPRVGEPCGPKGLARCNEGYACLGPDVKLTALKRHTCALADDGKIWCWGDNPLG